MEFITTEQFLKEDKEVQKVFIDWWKPSIGDLFKYNYGYSSIEIINLKSIKEDTEKSKYSAHIIPLLTEGQIRKFIEDKTNSILDFDYIVDHYEFFLLSKNECIEKDELFDNLGNDLLQAYWEVAVQIAREEVLKLQR